MKITKPVFLEVNQKPFGNNLIYVIAGWRRRAYEHRRSADEMRFEQEEERSSNQKLRKRNQERNQKGDPRGDCEKQPDHYRFTAN